MQNFQRLSNKGYIRYFLNLPTDSNFFAVTGVVFQKRIAM